MMMKSADVIARMKAKFSKYGYDETIFMRDLYSKIVKADGISGRGDLYFKESTVKAYEDFVASEFEAIYRKAKRMFSTVMSRKAKSKNSKSQAQEDKERLRRLLQCHGYAGTRCVLKILTS